MLRRRGGSEAGRGRVLKTDRFDQMGQGNNELGETGTGTRRPCYQWIYLSSFGTSWPRTRDKYLPINARPTVVPRIACRQKHIPNKINMALGYRTTGTRLNKVEEGDQKYNGFIG